MSDTGTPKRRLKLPPGYSPGGSSPAPAASASPSAAQTSISRFFSPVSSAATQIETAASAPATPSPSKLNFKKFLDSARTSSPTACTQNKQLPEGASRKRALSLVEEFGYSPTPSSDSSGEPPRKKRKIINDSDEDDHGDDDRDGDFDAAAHDDDDDDDEYLADAVVDDDESVGDAEEEDEEDEEDVPLKRKKSSSEGKKAISTPTTSKGTFKRLSRRPTKPPSEDLIGTSMDVDTGDAAASDNSAITAEGLPAHLFETNVKRHAQFVRYLATAPVPKDSSYIIGDAPPPVMEDGEEGAGGGSDDDNESYEEKCKTKAKTSKSASSSDVKYTPLEQQFLAIKKKYPDAVLAVECGYKFRFFGDDAEVAAKVLNIFAHRDHNFMTASIPAHRVPIHVRRLVAAGYKVGVVRQTETAALRAKAKSEKKPGTAGSKTFSRELSALYTASTLIQEDDADVALFGPSASAGESATGRPVSTADDTAETTNASNYLICVHESPSGGMGTSHLVRMSLVAVQVSTGDVVIDEWSDDFMRGGLETRLAHLQPIGELLLPKADTPYWSKQSDRALMLFVAPTVRIERVDVDKFEYDAALLKITEFYRSREISQGTEDSGDGEQLAKILSLPRGIFVALGVAIGYLEGFGTLADVFRLGGAAALQPFGDIAHMRLDGHTLANLEILRCQDTGKPRGSLLWILNHTQTSFGARLLTKWICQPLLDRAKIMERLDAVEELATADVLCIQPMLDLLRSLPDLERALCRIHYRKTTPAEVYKVLRAFDRVLQTMPAKDVVTRSIKSPLLSRIFTTMPSLDKELEHFLNSISPTAAQEGDKTKLFVSEEQFPEISEIKANIVNIERALKDHLKEVQAKLGLKRKLEFVSKLGTDYIIELTKAEAAKAPAGWIMVSGTKTHTRFHTPLIVEKTKKIQENKEQLDLVCERAWNTFLGEFADCYPKFRTVVANLALLDCLAALATVAKQPGYVRPKLLDNTVPQTIDIDSGRHPIVEALISDAFVPNSLQMRQDDISCLVISGPNMGGKTCLLRQTALIAIMAQLGSFVPANSATLSVFDGVYTRMGAYDRIERGQSTYFVELNEASEILRKATHRSLVIMDELGRGTSTHDGVALAYATLDYLVNELRCLSLFVTHYTLLNDYPSPHVANYHMAFLESSRMLDDFSTVAPESSTESDSGTTVATDITFLYKLTRGAAHKSYGLNVAKLAAIPPHILARAQAKSKELEQATVARMQGYKETVVVYEKIHEMVSEALAAFDTGDETKGGEKLEQLRSVWRERKAAHAAAGG